MCVCVCVYVCVCVCVYVCVCGSVSFILLYLPNRSLLVVFLSEEFLLTENYSDLFLSALVSLFYLPCGAVSPRQLICRLSTYTDTGVYLNLPPTLGKILVITIDLLVLSPDRLL